ncbi:Up-regulated during septation-domain-containing protein [Trametes polyzona]|nr:Up-regulated during septation-domain-containing protein [Trametes polyzona]
MNGVRRFLGGGTGSVTSTPSSQTSPLPPSSPPSSTNPLNVPPKPSWPPSSPPQNGAALAADESPKMTTAALFFRKDRQRPPPNGAPASASRSDEDTGNSSFQSSRDSVDSGRTSTQPSSPVAGPSSPRMPMPMRVSELSRKPVDGDARRSSILSSKDDLLMSLLASEAIVDSRGCEVLSAEEVEELKKEYTVLSSRLVALNKKLTLETKIRDAALSLSRANASYKGVSKQTSEQLENANRKVDVAQKELWRVSERAGEIQRRLLEHRAGVLSYSLRSMEKKMAPPDAPLNGNGDVFASGYNTPNRNSQMSPTQSSVSAHSNSSRSRFDGAHFFAGHSDAIVPTPTRLGASSAEVAALQEQLKTVQAALEAANAQQQKLASEASSLRTEREQIETSMGIELRQAEDMIAALERQLADMKGLGDRLAALEEEKEAWAQDRQELEERRREVDTLERRLEVLEEQSGEMSEIQTLLARERGDGARRLEEKERELAEVRARADAERAAWLAEKAALQAGGASRDELERGADALQELMQTHGILLYSRDTSIRGLAASIGRHLEDLKAKTDGHAKAQEEWNATRAKLEEDIRAGLDKREALVQEVEEARKERDAAKAEARSYEARLRDIQESGNGPVVEYTGDAAKITSVLEPIWAALPSPEARVSKLGKGKVAPSPTTASPVLTRSGASLSEMDVRSLKTLYDPNAFPLSARPGTSETFTVEAFAARVQALIADDRALIERLIRFAQAHDLLKKNAERAQKLAQESNAALETYQKQVKLLEDRNVSMISKQAALQDEVQNLQEAVERITAEKLELETQAAEQAETCRQLTDANNSLSARVLKLAEEGASASDAVRKRMEAELADCKAALARAQDEIESLRVSQQTQQMALLEELNTVQTENTSLRAQLRKK